MLGPRGSAFDEDDVADDNDDEDLKNDPISQMDMTVSQMPAFVAHARRVCLTAPFLAPRRRTSSRS